MLSRNLNLPDAFGETIDRSLAGNPASLAFADEFLAHLDRNSSGTGVADGDPVCVLDVGTGFARIPIEICMRRGGIGFTAVDRATRALQTARRNVEQAGMSRVIRIEQAEAISLPYATASFDAVISSSLLHHVSNRLDALREMTRVLRPGGLLLVRDTLRASDAGQIAQILSRNNDSANDNSRQVFQNAFHAMLNIDEARELSLAAGLPARSVRQAGPRHWMLEFRLPRISDLTHLNEFPSARAG